MADPIVKVHSVFGDDVHFKALTGSEELGRPFRYEVELLSEKLGLDLTSQLGGYLGVALAGDDDEREIGGFVTEMSYEGMFAGRHLYQAVLRPELWFLSFRSNNRIFQEKTALDIFKDVMQELGTSDYEDRTTNTYQPRPYCVQYGETDFDFVSRLLEEEGIYYFFLVNGGVQKLILADDYEAHGTRPGCETLPFFPPGVSIAEREHVSAWSKAERVESRTVTLKSYDFQQPTADLTVTKTANVQHARSSAELYEYGKLYTPKSVGTHLADVKTSEQRASAETAQGICNVKGVQAGLLFSLDEHPDASQNREWLVVGASYDVEASDWETRGDSTGPEYACSFLAMDSASPFKTAQTTSKAVMRGPQTAVVVGPSGEEVWVDEFGRVKVQFHWDRLGKSNEYSSCWVRVSTSLAGQKWGFIAIPRIGQEVVVDFLEGDPDQPIITGTVYNKDNMPPYVLPDNKTQSGLKSRSSKNGTDDNFNELRFEDMKDKEMIYFHAEKDFHRVVENDDSLEVGLSKKDKGNQTIVIHNDRTATLREGNDKLTVEKGNQTIKVDKKISIEAGDELSIKVGQATLVMKKNGDITWKGKQVDVKATNNVSVKANNTLDLKGTAKVAASGAQVKIAGQAKTDITGAMTKVAGSAMLDLNASGMAKLKGSITMIG